MVVALLAVVVTALTGAPAVAAGADAPVPDGPVSGRLVPALRGAAANAAVEPRVTERFRELGAARHGAAPARTTDITPWQGSLHTVWGAFPNSASNGAQATQTVNPGIHMSP